MFGFPNSGFIRWFQKWIVYLYESCQPFLSIRLLHLATLDYLLCVNFINIFKRRGFMIKLNIYKKLYFPLLNFILCSLSIFSYQNFSLFLLFFNKHTSSFYRQYFTQNIFFLNYSNFFH